MPPKFEKNDQGRYLTSGLDEKKFQQVFKAIESAQRKNRRNANRTLTPNQLREKSKSAIAKLGEKSKGVPFTVEDLKAFATSRNNFKKKYDSKTDGITYAQIVSGSREVDINRANNTVKDGTGITSARLNGVKHNEVIIRVKASMESVHEEHLVRLRFEEWDDLLQDPPGDSYEKAVKTACKGRISIACDCGRHQYWYRYLATMGRYAIAPPKEFSFPKDRNPEMKGVACKHVLKSVVMAQSKAWQSILVKQMTLQAKRIGFGDDRRFSHILTQDEQKAAARNRSTLIDKGKADKAAAKDFKNYKRSQAALAKKLKVDEVTAKRLKLALNRKRKVEIKNAKLTQQLQQQKDTIKAMYGLMRDAYKLQGKGVGDVVRDMAKHLQVSESKIKAIIK